MLPLMIWKNINSTKYYTNFRIIVVNLSSFRGRCKPRKSKIQYTRIKQRSATNSLQHIAADMQNNLEKLTFLPKWSEILYWKISVNLYKLIPINNNTSRLPQKLKIILFVQRHLAVSCVIAVIFLSISLKLLRFLDYSCFQSVHISTGFVSIFPS